MQLCSNGLHVYLSNIWKSYSGQMLSFALSSFIPNPSQVQHPSRFRPLHGTSHKRSQNLSTSNQNKRKRNQQSNIWSQSSWNPQNCSKYFIKLVVHYRSKVCGQYDFLNISRLLNEVSYAHQGCIYLIINGVKTENFEILLHFKCFYRRFW